MSLDHSAEAVTQALAKAGIASPQGRYERIPGGYRGVAFREEGPAYFVWIESQGAPRVAPARGEKEVADLDAMAKSFPAEFGEKSLGSGLPAPQSEEKDVGDQDQLVREVHPGSTASAGTPDSPEVGRDWHGDEGGEKDDEGEEKDEDAVPDDSAATDEKIASLHDVAVRLRRASIRALPKTSLEERYMREEVHKSVGQEMTPAERSRYEQWRVQWLRGMADRLHRKAGE